MKFLQDTAKKNQYLIRASTFSFYIFYKYNDDIMQHIRMKIVNMNHGMKKR